MTIRKQKEKGWFIYKFLAYLEICLLLFTKTKYKILGNQIINQNKPRKSQLEIFKNVDFQVLYTQKFTKLQMSRPKAMKKKERERKEIAYYLYYYLFPRRANKRIENYNTYILLTTLTFPFSLLEAPHESNLNV